MSAKCKSVVSSCSKQAIIRSVRRLFDHLVGKHKEQFWDCKSDRLGSLEIDHQFEIRRRLHRKITWRFSFQDSINVGDWLPYHIVKVVGIGHQCTAVRRTGNGIYGREFK